MDFFCPNCKSKTTELIECDSCQSIGCPRCMRRNNKVWVCYDCKSGKHHSNSEDQVTNAFASMFG